MPNFSLGGVFFQQVTFLDSRLFSFFFHGNPLAAQSRRALARSGPRPSALLSIRAARNAVNQDLNARHGTHLRVAFWILGPAKTEGLQHAPPRWLVLFPSGKEVGSRKDFWGGCLWKPFGGDFGGSRVLQPGLPRVSPVASLLPLPGGSEGLSKLRKVKEALGNSSAAPGLVKSKRGPRRFSFLESWAGAFPFLRKKGRLPFVPEKLLGFIFRRRLLLIAALCWRRRAAQGCLPPEGSGGVGRGENLTAPRKPHFFWVFL